MFTIEDVKQLLQRAGISFVQTDFPSEREYWMAYSPYAYLTKAQQWPVSVLRIQGGHEKTPLYIDFLPCGDSMVLRDLNFGRYSYEIYTFDDETVLPMLLKEIRAVLTGRTHIIYSWDSRTFHWCGEACFNVAPGDADDQSAAYETAVCKIERSKGWRRIFGKRIIHAVYSWHSYREIVR